MSRATTTSAPVDRELVTELAPSPGASSLYGTGVSAMFSGAGEVSGEALEAEDFTGVFGGSCCSRAAFGGFLGENLRVPGVVAGFVGVVGFVTLQANLLLNLKV